MEDRVTNPSVVSQQKKHEIKYNIGNQGPTS